MYVGTAKIHNRVTGRIHVAWFSERPWPGNRPDDAMRWQSRMHHTDGAATEAEADEHMAALRKQLSSLGYTSAVDLGVAEWDGSGVPAMICAKRYLIAQMTTGWRTPANQIPSWWRVAAGR